MFVCLCGTASGRSQTLHVPVRASLLSLVHRSTHLPYDKEDESGAQHQGEHVAEGRKGERHGRASQPDDEASRERKGNVPPAPCSSVAIARSPSSLGPRLCVVLPDVSRVWLVQVDKSLAFSRSQ